jgi:hypothetical protein
MSLAVIEGAKPPSSTSEASREGIQRSQEQALVQPIRTGGSEDARTGWLHVLRHIYDPRGRKGWYDAHHVPDGVQA